MQYLRTERKAAASAKALETYAAMVTSRTAGKVWADPTGGKFDLGLYVAALLLVWQEVAGDELKEPNAIQVAGMLVAAAAKADAGKAYVALDATHHLAKFMEAHKGKSAARQDAIRYGDDGQQVVLAFALDCVRVLTYKDVTARQSAVSATRRGGESRRAAIGRAATTSAVFTMLLTDISALTDDTGPSMTAFLAAVGQDILSEVRLAEVLGATEFEQLRVYLRCGLPSDVLDVAAQRNNILAWIGQADASGGGEGGRGEGVRRA